MLKNWGTVAASFGVVRARRRVVSMIDHANVEGRAVRPMLNEVTPPYLSLTECSKEEEWCRDRPKSVTFFEGRVRTQRLAVVRVAAAITYGFSGVHRKQQSPDQGAQLCMTTVMLVML